MEYRIMRVSVYEMDHGQCPYLENRKWITHSFSSAEVDPRMYENLLSRGWRRSGTTYYQNHCPGCMSCIPIRVPVEGFVPSKSQRRVMRRNGNVRFTVEPSAFDRETYELYCRYVESRHNSGDTTTELEFEHFLADSPQTTEVMRYYEGNRLLGAGWIDVMPDGLSSVYFAFDPQESSRSLGTYSVTQEIAYARALGKKWLYLGFYVPGSRKMAYKANFKPHQLLLNGTWSDLSGLSENTGTSTLSAEDPKSPEGTVS